MNDRAHQFRLIQKRLLVRYKDRNPAPLNNLDVLLEGTYHSLIDCATHIDELKQQLSDHSNRLSCATHLLLMLMRYRFELDDASFEILSSHLSPTVVDGLEQGWEETTDAAMTHLLRTVLARSSKEGMTAAPAIQMPTDTSKLRKHITIVCDRLSRGAKLFKPRKSKK